MLARWIEGGLQGLLEVSHQDLRNQGGEVGGKLLEGFRVDGVVLLGEEGIRSGEAPRYFVADKLNRIE